MDDRVRRRRVDVRYAARLSEESIAIFHPAASVEFVSLVSDIVDHPPFLKHTSQKKLPPLLGSTRFLGRVQDGRATYFFPYMATACHDNFFSHLFRKPSELLRIGITIVQHVPSCALRAWGSCAAHPDRRHQRLRRRPPSTLPPPSASTRRLTRWPRRTPRPLRYSTAAR